MGSRRVLVLLQGGERRDEPVTARTDCARSEIGEEVDGGGGAGEQLVGQRAELEALGHGVARGKQLVGCSVSSRAGLAASTPWCGPRNL